MYIISIKNAVHCKDQSNQRNWHSGIYNFNQNRLIDVFKFMPLSFHYFSSDWMSLVSLQLTSFCHLINSWKACYYYIDVSGNNTFSWDFYWLSTCFWTKSKTDTGLHHHGVSNSRLIQQITFWEKPWELKIK